MPSEVSRERGATAVEYALLISAVAIAIFLAVAFFGTQTAKLFEVPCHALGACP